MVLSGKRNILPGTRIGGAWAGVTSPAAVEREYVTALLDIAGDCRLLWVPDPSGGAVTDRSRHQRVATYSAELGRFTKKPERLGLGWAVRFNGEDEYASVPSATDLSPGDGGSDEAFSIVVLTNPISTSEAMFVAKRNDSTPAIEWSFGTGGASPLVLIFFDESSDGRIGRLGPALGANAWTLLCGTYDGSRASSGIRLYQDGGRSDSSDLSLGDYAAAESLGADVTLGHYTNAAGERESMLNGALALVMICGRQLPPEDVWQIKDLVNAYHGLSL